MMLLTKTLKPKTKIFLYCRLAESLEGLNSSLAQSTSGLWSCKVAWK